MAKKKKPRKMPRHWYKIYVEECPLCGCTQNWRERYYTPKPEYRENRCYYTEVYCGCWP